VPKPSNPDYLTAARTYLARGWCVLPAYPDRKYPCVKWREYQTRLPTDAELVEWFGPDRKPHFTNARLGMLTGAISGVVVIEWDPHNGAEQSFLDEFAETTGRIALSGEHDGVRGRHLYFKHPGVPTKNAALCFPHYPGVDIRGDGGFVMLPPSPHYSGVNYEWVSEGRLAPLPATLFIPRGSASANAEDDEPHVYPAAGSLVLTDEQVQAIIHAMEWKGGQKHYQALALTGALLKAGVSPEQTSAIVSRACGSDDPRVLKDHRSRLESTLKRIAHGETVAGLSRLGLGDEATTTITDILYPRVELLDDDGPTADDLVWAHEVLPKPVNWLVPDRLLFGKVNIIEGDPDVMKTTVCIDILARLTTGATMPLCDRRHEPANVLVVSYEDDFEDTLRPRFEAAGADLRRVAFWKLERLPTLPTDVNRLKTPIVEHNIKAVLIDPVTGAVDETLDVNTDAVLRRAVMVPLRRIAAETGAAVIVIRHWNKNTSEKKLMYRGGGSIAYTATARSTLAVLVDTESDVHALRTVKCNLASKASKRRAMTFQPETVELTYDHLTEPIPVPTIRWLDLQDIPDKDDQANPKEVKAKKERAKARQLILSELLLQSPRTRAYLDKKRSEATISERAFKYAANDLVEEHILVITPAKTRTQPDLWTIPADVFPILADGPADELPKPPPSPCGTPVGSTMRAPITEATPSQPSTTKSARAIVMQNVRTAVERGDSAPPPSASTPQGDAANKPATDAEASVARRTLK
jgi:RecA-family ATPase